MPVLNNARHERFAQEIAKGKTASEAYVAAGYKANDGNAIRLKGNERVAARLNELLDRAVEKTEITLERWTQEVTGIALADIRDILEFGSGGVKLKEGVTLTPAQAALISEISETPNGVRVKLHPKMDALEKLAKRFGWYAPEMHQHEVVVTKAVREIIRPPNAARDRA